MSANVKDMKSSIPFRCIARAFFVVTTLGLLIGGLARSQAATSSGHPDTAGWKNLFADDLSNAVVNPGGWKVEHGILSAKDHSTIWTKDSYSDFVLDLEFKVEKEANSGVFLRAGNIRNVLSALEIQVHETSDGGRIGMVGALYDAKAPSKKLQKPVGEWNRYTITCNDSHLKLVFNGEVAMDIDLNDWKEARKNPDGTPNKFAKALKDFSRTGPIGFQGLHGKAEAPVWYRNLKIKSLN